MGRYGWVLGGELGLELWGRGRGSRLFFIDYIVDLAGEVGVGIYGFIAGFWKGVGLFCTDNVVDVFFVVWRRIG